MSIELGVFIAYLDRMVSVVAAHQESASGCISKEIELSTWQVPSKSPARSRGDQIGVGSCNRCRYPRSRHSLKSRFRLHPWPNRSFRYRRPPGRRTPKLRCRYHLRFHKNDNCIDSPFGAALVRVDHSHGLIGSDLNDVHRSIGRNSDRYRRLHCALPPFATDQEVLMVVPSTSALAFQLQPAFATTAPKIGDKHAHYLLEFVRIYA